jgi:lipopolysaccharide/colanic/teichoic acid biosynthesis glycosyltransferase
MELVRVTTKTIERTDFEPVIEELCSSNECEVEVADISSPESVEAEPSIPLREPNPARRAVNIVASLILLAIASPIMLLIAFLIKATSPGPVVY